MFRFLRRKPRTMHDALVETLYGKGVATNRSDLEKAIDLAHRDLLNELVDRDAVASLASDIRDGSIPYSTEDLAISTALKFFRQPELMYDLRTVQIQARLTVLQWFEAGNVNVMLARAFDQVLYNDYREVVGARECR